MVFQEHCIFLRYTSTLSSVDDYGFCQADVYCSGSVLCLVHGGEVERWVAAVGWSLHRWLQVQGYAWLITKGLQKLKPISAHSQRAKAHSPQKGRQRPGFSQTSEQAWKWAVYVPSSVTFVWRHCVFTLSQKLSIVLFCLLSFFRLAVNMMCVSHYFETCQKLTKWTENVNKICLTVNVTESRSTVAGSYVNLLITLN